MNGLLQPKKFRSEAMTVGLLAAVQFCHILDFVIMMPLGPQLMADLQISATEFGVLVSSYSIAAAVTGFLMAVLLDRFERRRGLLFLFAGFVVATLACGLSPNYPSLLAARIFAGCFGGVVGASVFAILGEVIPPHRRGRAMGVVMSSFSLASVAGVPAGLALAMHWGWNAPFLALGALSVPVGALVFVVLPKLDTHLKATVIEGDTGRPAFVEFFRSLWAVAVFRPHFLAFCMVSFLMMSGFFLIPFIATHLVYNLGLPQADLPLVYFFGGIGTIVSAQIIGRCTDAFGHLRVLFVVTVLSWIPVLMLSNEWISGRTQVFLVMTAFMMFVSGRMVPSMALVTAACDPKRRGTFMSLFTSVQAASMGVAALISSKIVTEQSDSRLTGFSWLGYLFVAASLVTLFMAKQVAAWAKHNGS